MIESWQKIGQKIMFNQFVEGEIKGVVLKLHIQNNFDNKQYD